MAQNTLMEIYILNKNLLFIPNMFILFLRIHMGQMLASENFHPVIVKLKDQLFSRVYEATVSYFPFYHKFLNIIL